MRDETAEKSGPLRSGFTTGSCATATSLAAASLLLTGEACDAVTIVLPKGQRLTLRLEECRRMHGTDTATATIIKDAGDDPDVTHGARIFANIRLCPTPETSFHAGPGVGTITLPGLMLPPGEPAINPTPRQMIRDHLQQLAAHCGYTGGFAVTIGVVNGEALALKTMNGRLGIVGGLSILGTTGIVRPFSCSAYIASIQQGMDVACANGYKHIAACTGNASEDTMRQRYTLDDTALIEMGDFAGAVLKHLRKTFIPRVSVCGGFGKISKLAAGHLDLHSRHSSIDLPQLARWAGDSGASQALQDAICAANTSQQALSMAHAEGIPLGDTVCRHALAFARSIVPTRTQLEIIAIDRQGNIVGSAGNVTPRILVLGGTTEALSLARALPDNAVYSLAGLGRTPADLPCSVRVGGFGGTTGLAHYLSGEGIELILDLTHPYAAQMSRHAADASARTGVPCWALRRPVWQSGPDDDWREFTGWQALTKALATFRRPLFTLGKEPLAHLDEIPAHQHWTIRCLEGRNTVPGATIIAARGPFTLEDERRFIRENAFDVIVSKNSGSVATEPKLQVAREFGLPVLMQARPVLPQVTREFTSLDEMQTALRAWLP